MANQVIRVGMVGLGNWARYGHLPALTHLPNYVVTAVWSRRADHAAAVAKEFAVAAVEAEYRSLVTRPDVDLVAVLVPAPQHAEVVQTAIAAGKDVYCEWPLATTTADGEDLSARATRASVRHVVGLQRRFGPSARYLRELMADGFVGTVRSVRMHVSMEYFTERRGPGLEWTGRPG
jgi:predicted dehydrogenase